MESRSTYLTLSRGRHHLRHWGDEVAPLLLLLHGWLDVSATFQFLAEALPARWHLVAPDWRGYGRSDWQHRPYWLAELIADLDELVEHLIHHPDHFLGAWSHIKAPTLWVTGDESETLERFARTAGSFDGVAARLRHVPDLQAEVLAQAGHNPQHDQPEALAALMASFLSRA